MGAVQIKTAPPPNASSFGPQYVDTALKSMMHTKPSRQSFFGTAKKSGLKIPLKPSDLCGGGKPVSIDSKTGQTFREAARDVRLHPPIQTSCGFKFV